MRQDLRKRMVVAAAATGLLSLYGTSALADTGAHGAASNSPGVASGNAVEVPVTVPVNICGNTVDAASLGNPSIGNECGTTGDHAPEEARSIQDAPQRQATPVAEPEYAPAAAADPEDSWEQAYEEYTRPDAYEEATPPDTHEQYIQPAEHPQYGDDEVDEGYGDDEGHGNDGYGDDEGHGNEGYGHDGGAQGGHEDTPGDYGDGPDTDEDTEVGYGDTPPTKPPHQPPTKPPTTKPPTKPPTTKPPTGHPSPTGKPPTTKPPTKPPVTAPPTTKPPTGHPSPTDKPPTGGPSTSHPPTDHPPTLPETGSDPEVLLAAGAAGLALIAGGSILYRRGRAASGR